ncbi:MAG: porin [Usitatibacter sp.]
MRISKRVLAAAALGALGIASARADEADFALTLSGFGTIGAAHSDNDKADYLVDAFHPNGPGFTRSLSFDPDTRAGVQATVTLPLKLTAVLQLVTQQHYDNSYRPDVEWANVKYQATPDFSIRAGRTVLPVFLSTDTRKVGYANPWLRPPVEVYSLVPVTSTDGLDASYRMRVGDAANNTFQATLGRSEAKFPTAAGLGEGTAKAKNILTLVDTFEAGFATVRLTYGQASLTIPQYAPLFDALRQMGPQGESLASRYDVNGRKVDFLGVGASYDPGTWFAIAEWARFDTHSVLGAKSAWYVSAGPRLGKFTPFATYARMKADRSTTDPGLNVALLPASAAPTAALLNAALASQLDSIPRQSTLSLGLRWDFWRNAAFKVQYDRVALAPGSHGTFGNIQPGFEPGGTVRLFSAAVDFVF